LRLLLDTHALIWWLTDNRRLSAKARAAVADPNNAVFASAASGYEVANKQRLGKLPGRIAQDLSTALRQARIPSTRSPSTTRSRQGYCRARTAIPGTV
jgi:PIN domain nuclease of toxin-antitoxin system